jgi:hypothetical protein
MQPDQKISDAFVTRPEPLGRTASQLVGQWRSRLGIQANALRA